MEINLLAKNDTADIRRLIRKYDSVYKRTRWEKPTIAIIFCSLTYYLFAILMHILIIILLWTLLFALREDFFASQETAGVYSITGAVLQGTFMGMCVIVCFYSIYDTVCTFWTKDIFSGRDIKKFLNDLSNGRLNLVTAEDVECSFTTEKQLTANCGANAGMNVAWVLHPCGRPSNNSNDVYVMTSVYGDIGPSASRAPSISMRVQTTKDMDKWEEMTMPKRTQVHCVKVNLFPWIPWTYFLITDKSAETVLHDFETAMVFVIHDIVVNKLKKSIHEGTPIEKPSQNKDNGYPANRFLVMEEDLIPYFKKEDSLRNPVTSEKMDILDTAVRDCVSEQHLSDIMIRNNKHLFSVEDVQGVIEQVENGDMCLVRTKDVQLELTPFRRASYKDLTGTWTFKQSRQSEKRKIMTSIYGEEGPSYKYKINSVIKFPDKANVERWMKIPAPNAIYVPCVEVNLFPDIVDNEWVYLLTVMNGESAEDIQKVFKPICLEIVRRILLEKLRKVTEAYGFIEKDSGNGCRLITKECLVPFFKKSKTKDSSYTFSEIELLAETVKKYNIAHQTVANDMLKIGQDG